MGVFLERSGREEPVRRGPTREIARGGAAAGKKLAHDGFVRAGVVHRSNAKAGVRPSDAQQRTSVCRVPDSTARAEEASCKVQSRSVRLRSQWDWDAACQTSMPRPIAVSYPPHVMGKLACARDAKRCVLRRGHSVLR